MQGIKHPAHLQLSITAAAAIGTHRAYMAHCTSTCVVPRLKNELVGYWCSGDMTLTVAIMLAALLRTVACKDGSRRRLRMKQPVITILAHIIEP